MQPLQRPRRIIRARQRDREGSLLGFDRNLVPMDYEWGVDLIMIHVEGAWRAASTGADFFQQAVGVPQIDWFRQPDRRRNQFKLRTRSWTRSQSSPTLGDLAIVANAMHSNRGTISVELKGNPTRTLGSLLRRFGDREDFATFIAQLSPIEFFAPAQDDALHLSLDGQTNWLPNPAQARHLIGRDIFAEFLPTYVDQVQRFVAIVVSDGDAECSADGADHVIRSAAGSIRLGWGEARVPQIETYFERFHRGACGAVRIAGAALLNEDHHGELRRYGENLDFEREGDCFRILLPIGETRKLVIYAKLQNRIRFEVRRHGRGRYPQAVIAAPPDRLLAIVQSEREEGSSCCRWQDVGRLFDEPDRTSVGDLVELIAHIVGACGLPNATVREVAYRLIVDGGFSDIQAIQQPEDLIRRLVATGVIRRTRLRRRDLRAQPHRYSLAPDFRDLREGLLAALLRASA